MHEDKDHQILLGYLNVCNGYPQSGEQDYLELSKNTSGMVVKVPDGTGLPRNKGRQECKLIMFADMLISR